MSEHDWNEGFLAGEKTERRERDAAMEMLKDMRDQLFEARQAVLKEGLEVKRLRAIIRALGYDPDTEGYRAALAKDGP